VYKFFSLQAAFLPNIKLRGNVKNTTSPSSGLGSVLICRSPLLTTFLVIAVFGVAVSPVNSKFKFMHEFRYTADHILVRTKCI
jgi:hypothetical protein